MNGFRVNPGTSDRPPELSGDAVHVWRVNFSTCAGSAGAYANTLSQSELERANRFRFADDRERFIVARGALRATLGNYLDIKPEQVEFTYGSNGKPALASRNAGVQFNMSHSRNLALVAFTSTGKIGVDIEYMDDSLEVEAIAGRFFSALEVQTLLTLPAEARRLGFFNCWTRKEAFVKALGSGLSYPLQQFDVTLSPGAPPALLRHRLQPDQSQRWSLHSFTPAPDYAAAVAVEGKRDLLLYHYHCAN